MLQFPFFGAISKTRHPTIENVISRLLAVVRGTTLDLYAIDVSIRIRAPSEKTRLAHFGSYAKEASDGHNVEAKVVAYILIANRKLYFTKISLSVWKFCRLKIKMGHAYRVISDQAWAELFTRYACSKF